MKIRRIDLRAFFGHEETAIELPERGVVVVTGKNGQGKSGGTVEAVSVGLWGRSIRGTPWHALGFHSQVIVWTDAVRCERMKGKILRWEPNLSSTIGQALRSCDLLNGAPWAPGNDFVTNKAAQEALDAIIEPWDVWRRTKVFSASDAQSFSLATDAERKQLIESILTLDRFDPALEACKVDLKAAMGLLDVVRRECAIASSLLDAAEERERKLRLDYEQHQQRVAPEPHELSPGRSAGELAADLCAVRGDVAALQPQILTTAKAIGRLEVRAEQARRAAKEGRSSCELCGQALERDLLCEAQAREQAEELEEALATARTAQQAISDELAVLTENVTRLERAYNNRLREEKVVSDRQLTIDAFSGMLAQRGREVEAAQVEVDLAAVRVEKADRAANLAEREVALEEACASVLGMRGVRAVILDDALGAIEEASSGWLSRLGSTMTLRLSSRTERKSSEGSVNAIALELDGAGAGYGYRAASAGERRRVDLALLLGLGEVASAARADHGSTLWFDEVFDALDEDGRAAAAEMIGDLAKDRTCVVITHQDDLTRRIDAALRLHVDGGKVTIL